MEKLEIRYNLVKEDGTIVETYGSSFDTNADWLETWLIQYKNETCIVDSQNNIILLGKYEINEKEWFQLDEHDIKLEEYPTFLDRLTAFIDYINRNEKPLVDGRCIAFDLLCKSPYVENLEKFVWAAEIPLEIYQAYQEEKLETEQSTNHTIGEFLPDWFKHHDSLSKTEYENMKVFHENNPQ